MFEEVTLKPCPFCGKRAKMRRDNYEVRYRATCEDYDCFAGGIWYYKELDAIDAWNRRTPEPGTSVVRWVRYDGTTETLPEIVDRCSHYVLLNDGIDRLGVWMKRIIWVQADRQPSIGDVWAYLPEPPEGMG